MTGTVFPLVVTLAIQALISLATLSAAVMAPLAAPALGTRPELVGLFVGIVYAGAMVTSLASGAVIARHGAIRTSQFSLLFGAAGLALAISGVLAAVPVGAALIGLGYGMVTPASSHLLARTTPPHRMGIVLSLKQTGVPIGGAMAGLILPPAAAAVGWQMAVTGVIVACLALALLAQTIRAAFDDDRDPAAPRTPLRGALAPLGIVLGHPQLRDLAIASFVFGAMQLVLMGYLVVFLTHAREMPLALAGGMLAVAQAAGVAGRLLWGWLADVAVPPRRLMALLSLAMAGCAVGLAESGSGWPMAAWGLLCALFGATAIGWNGVFLAEIARVMPAGRAGSATGGGLFVTFAGVVAGPPAFAAAVASGGGYAPALLGLALILLAIGLMLWRRPLRRQSCP